MLKESINRAIRKHPETSLNRANRNCCTWDTYVAYLACMQWQKRWHLNRGCSCKANHASDKLACLQPIRPACDESHVSKPDTKPPSFSIKATTLTCHSAKSRCALDEWRITAFKKHMKRAEPGKTPLQQDMNKKHFPNSTTKCPLNQPKTCKAHSKRVHLHPMVKGRCFGAYLRSRSVLRRLSPAALGA